MILFRADANTSIGMGHIMRCLSIADAIAALSEPTIISRGKDSIKFILADETVAELIKSRGFEPIILHSNYDDMNAELPLWEELSSSIDADLVIVDSYYVTPTYLSFLRENIGTVCYIDDVLSFPYPVDILVNYYAYAEEQAYQELYGARELPQLILGPTYAPLREMFRNIPVRTQPEKIKNVLISTGGSDELHVALHFIKYLCDERKQGEHEQDGTTYHVLVGAMNTDKDAIRSLAKGKDWIVLHENVADMKSLISSVDIAISAAGSTLYEICACGVPLITYSIADNQVPGAEAFQCLGLAVNIGDLREESSIDHDLIMSGTLAEDAIEKLIRAENVLATDLEKRNKMTTRQQGTIDGRGAERLATKVIESIGRNIRAV